MEIIAEKGLESLATKVESDLERVLEERAILGLGFPEDFEVYVHYYNNNNVLAAATYDDLMPSIEINVVPSIIVDKKRLSGRTKKDLFRVKNYFELCRALFDDVGEETILSLMQYPRKTILDIEGKLSRKQFAKFKEQFKAYGKKYEEFRSQVMMQAKTARDSFVRLEPALLSRYRGLGCSHIRHEMDHLDFYTSRLYRRYDAFMLEFKETQERIADGKKTDVEQYKGALRKYLKLQSEVTVLAETRAIFFNEVDVSKWGSVDYEKVKRKVFGRFHEDYMESCFLERVIDALLDLRIDSPELTGDTKNYLRGIILEQFVSSDAVQYSAKADNVNYEIVGEILYEEIPRWKIILFDNAKTATEVIGNTFRDNPARFADAQNARTFNEYLRVLDS